MQVIHFTDPACPFAFSAEPMRLQLRWHYGDQLEWRTVLVGLAEDPSDLEKKGLKPSMLAKGMAMLRDKYGMPIDASERARLAASVPACRAVVATRLHRPELEEAVLRRLRIRTFAGELLDADETIDGAASDVGIEPGELRAWMAEEATEAALREDFRAARDPHPSALVLDHKLADAGTPEGGRRYTCPSYELRADGETFGVAPGMQPWETYDVLVANADDSLERHPAPKDAREVLEWAAEPLATVEVAALLGSEPDAVREGLEAIATFEPVGQDGYWTLTA